MKFRIDGAVVAVCAVSFLCAFGASAIADSGAAKAKTERWRQVSAPTLSVNCISTPPPPCLGPLSRVSRNTARFFGSRLVGRAAENNPHDAYHGYFANPLDDPRYYGSGRTTPIFRSDRASWPI